MALPHLAYNPPPHCRQTHTVLIRVLFSLASKYLRGVPTPSILDVGCGRGEFMRTMAAWGARVCGIDPDPECVRLSRDAGPVYQGTLEDVFASCGEQLINAFDLVVASHTLEHMECPHKAMQIMRKISRRYILIAVPNPHHLLNTIAVSLGLRPPVNPTHLYSWDAPYLRVFLELHCGLRCLEWRGDWVQLVPFFRRFTYKLWPLTALETKVLPRIFPRLTESLVVMTEKK